MAQKEVIIAGMGPFLYDDADFPDGALSTDDQISTAGQDVTGGYSVNGIQVVGPQEAAIADAAAATASDLTLANTGDPTYGGDFTDIQTEVNAINDDVDEIRAQLNDALAALRSHGLIDT